MDVWCDGIIDCTHGDDEDGCANSDDVSLRSLARESGDGGVAAERPFPPPAMVEFYADGTHGTTELASGAPCPPTHFQCPDGYCLPVFVLCNSINDCPGWEDETGCDTYTCPGLYRCRGSRVCLHWDHLCDQVFQCPQHDDEAFCDTTCPQQCACTGLSYFCFRDFQAGHFTKARYVDAGGTGMSMVGFADNPLLVHLSLARCELTQVQDVYLPNLHSLDLSDNQLHVIDVRYVRRLGNLRVLFLARNPLRSQVFTHLPTDTPLPPLQTLDLSGAAVPQLDLTVFHHFLELKALNLSFCGLDTVTASVVSFQSQISSLDVRGNPLSSFPHDFVRGAATLQRVWADSYRVCCPQVLPEDFSHVHCRSPSDAVSSCHSLLKRAVYRVSTLVQASLALLGNLANFVIHVCVKKGFPSQSHGVFFLHLCISQAVMGVYQAIIAAADLGYRGDYVWQDVTWRGSVACHLAGLLYLLSTHTSMVLTCFLTLDPLLQLFSPGSRRQFTATSAHAVCALTWLFCLSVFGALSATTQLGQTALCVAPMPTQTREAGYDSVLGVTAVVSWVLLAWQTANQGLLLRALQSRPLAFVTEVSACRHMDTARRCSGVAKLHLLCWLPLGVASLLASRGVRVPGEVTSVVTLVTLPVSASLCSAVYYVSVLRQTQRYRQRQRLLQRVGWRDAAVERRKS